MLLVCAFLCASTAYAQLEVTSAPPITPQNLISNIFLGDGVEVLGITYEGPAVSVGAFTNGTANVGMDRGIVMTTGRAMSVPGSNGVDAPGNTQSSFNNLSTANDADLASIAAPRPINDVVKYTITFVPVADTLRFRYVFASEEYPEFVCSEFNDVFGFFISGPGITGPFQNNARNIALVPGTTLPVAINNINSGIVGNAGNPANCAPPNGSLAFSEFYVGNPGTNRPIFNGRTSVLTAEVVVMPCSTYTMKLVIADVQDNIYDSGVFLEAKSFGTGSLDVEAVTVSLDGSIAEGCAPGVLTFTLPNPVEADFPIDFNIFGTAINGVDYEFISNQGVFIPSGQNSVSIPIIAIEDGIPEDTETLLIDIQRDACNRDTIRILIRDNPLVPPNLGVDTMVCLGSPVLLTGELDVPLPEPPRFTNNTARPILETNIPNYSDILVQNVIPSTLASGVIKQVCIDSLSHRWIDDLDVYLISPSGQFLELTTDNGGNGGNGAGMDFYLNTCFTEAATVPINFPGPFAPPSAVPFTGEWLPEGVWSDLWSGGNRNTNGTWRLQVIDDSQGFTGTLHSWTICFNPIYDISYEWTPSAGLDCADCPNPIATPAQGTTTYTLVATDSYGCTVSDSLTITVEDVLPAPIVVCSSISEDSVAFSWDDIPGNNGYQVNIDTTIWEMPNGGLGHTVGNVQPGQNVSISVQAIGDCLGLIGTAVCTVPACVPPMFSSSSSDATCAGIADGSVTFTPLQGLGPYTYTLGGQTNSTGIFNGLAPGTYSAVVSDTANCPVTLGITIGEASAITTVTNLLQNVSCNGDSNGAAISQPNGGTGSFTYLWSNGETTQTASSLPGGPASVTITDSNGCTTISSLSIPEPAPLLTSTSTEAVSCGGAADGQATASPVGGTMPYDFLWDGNGQSTATATNLSGGTYTVVITDVNGCTTNATATVAENPVVSLAASGGDATCFGSADGFAQAMPTGGTGSGFTYQWTRLSDNMAVGTGQGIGQLEAGTYSVAVTDAAGCTASSEITIGEPSELTATLTTTPTGCTDSADGTATVVISGGTAGYTSIWDGGTGSDNINNLAAGSHTLLVRDANNCEVSLDFEIDAPAALSLDISSSPASCEAISDGTAIPLVAGGTAPYSYAWEDGQSDSIAVSLSAGDLSLLVTDANGCTISGSVTVGQLPDMMLEITHSDPGCFDAATGSAVVSATGGGGNYSYLWSNGQTSATATALPAGTYSIVVTDANGCQQSSQAVLDQPSLLSVTVADAALACHDSANGSLGAMPQGGTLPYTYAWSNGQTQATATALGTGTYTLDLTDANGCTASANATVSAPPALTASITGINATCFGLTNGSIQVSAQGGTGAYGYAWSNPALPNISNPALLGAGDYVVTITDGNNCQVSAAITITQPAALVLSALPRPVTCAGDSNGSIDLSVSGGTQPYTYNWSNGANTPIINGLTAGDYSVVVTDANGCTQQLASSVGQATILRTNITVENIDCFGDATGTARATVSGGTPPYELAWPDNSSGELFGPTVAGMYLLRITDGNGCVLEADIDIKQPEALAFVPLVQAVSCFDGRDGQIELMPTGGTPPYLYSTDNVTFNGASRLIGLRGGSYDAFLRDSKGCLYFETDIIVPEPEPLTIDLGADQTIPYGGSMRFYPQIDGNNGNVSYEWSPNNPDFLECGDCPSPLVTVTSQTSFLLLITDQNGCTAQDVATVFVTKDNPVLVPTGFTPNGDGNNDRLIVHGKEGIRILQFRVFDRWGELVYEASDFMTNDASRGWDGQFREQPMNGGVFIWHVVAEYEDGEQEAHKGQTTLIR